MGWTYERYIPKKSGGADWGQNSSTGPLVWTSLPVIHTGPGVHAGFWEMKHAAWAAGQAGADQ